MIKTNVTTWQLDFFVGLVNQVYRRGLKTQTPHPVKPDVWRDWRDDLVKRLHGVYKPAARPYAGRVMADIAIELLLYDVLWLLGEVDTLDWQLRTNRSEQASAKDRELREMRRLVADLRRDNAALCEQAEQLQEALARQPQTVTVDIPAQKVTVRSPLQHEILRLIGTEGQGRSWRIIERITAAGIAKENSTRNALQKLTRCGLVDDYRRHGRPVRWKITAGGNRRLVQLTEIGKAWFREAFGQEARESEIAVMARRHQSVTHGVGILEARDYLRAAGYAVDDDPAAILSIAEERWGARTEPDLIVTIDGEAWPVEVQREVSERLLSKWTKSLATVGRLALILFNEEHCRRQHAILERAGYGLPVGVIRLTSLEAMQRQEWSWVPFLHR